MKPHAIFQPKISSCRLVACPVKCICITEKSGCFELIQRQTMWFWRFAYVNYHLKSLAEVLRIKISKFVNIGFRCLTLT